MNIFEKCLIPINGTAKSVTSGGERFKYKRHIDGPTLSVKPKTYTPPDTIDDLTGQSRGKMTIVGYVGRFDKNRVWMARCKCGSYEARNGLAWRKGMNKNRPDQGCRDCSQHDRIIREEHYRRTGFNKE